MSLEHKAAIVTWHRKEKLTQAKVVDRVAEQRRELERQSKERGVQLRLPPAPGQGSAD